MERFKIKLAELDIEIECLFEETRLFCRDYLSDGKASFSVLSDRAMAENELTKTPEEVSVEYAERLSVYRQIAERLPFFSASVFHGAAITYGKKAFIFTAPSGTGKTTHIRLWREHIGREVGIINGDKPVLRLKDGDITAYGSPWCGKEMWQKNTSAPLCGICVIKRGFENKIRRLTEKDALKLLLKQIYLPKSAAGLTLTLDLLDNILKRVPVYELECNISREAVKVAFETLTEETIKE